MSSACNVRSEGSPVLTTDMRILLPDLVRAVDGIIHEINASIQLIHIAFFWCATARSDDTSAMVSQPPNPAGTIQISEELYLAYNTSKNASGCFRNILSGLELSPGLFAELKPLLGNIERKSVSFACHLEIGMKALAIPIPLHDWTLPTDSCENPLKAQADSMKTVAMCNLLVNQYRAFTVIKRDLIVIGQNM